MAAMRNIGADQTGQFNFEGDLRDHYFTMVHHQSKPNANAGGPCPMPADDADARSMLERCPYCYLPAIFTKCLSPHYRHSSLPAITII
jgi:hypothetical protein